MDDRTIRVRFLAEVNSYLDGAKKAADATVGFGKQMSGTGTAVKADMEKVGRSALLLAGGMGLALGAAAKAAMSWESSFAGVAKTVDGDLGELEAGLRDLAKTLPATHQEIAAVAEAAGQLGIAKASILDFTETMIALGETTNLTADEAATSIAQFMNIMQTAPADVDNLSSALVDLGNNGASTERDIVEMAQRLAGAGRMIGASEQEIFALASAMADLGIQAQLGGGAMSRQLRKINSAVFENGDTLRKWAEISNVTAAEFSKTWRTSPAAAMDLIAKGLGRVRDAGGDVAATLGEVGIKGTQDLDVMGRLAGAGDRISKSLGISNEAWEKNVALQEEAAKRYGTTESKMQVTKNKVNDLAIELGDRLLPSISAVLDMVGGLADAFGSLPGFVQTGVVALGGLTFAAAGLVGIAGTLIPKVRDLDKALSNMGLGANFASRNLGSIMRFGLKGGVIAIGLSLAGDALDSLLDKDFTGGAAGISRLENALAKLGQGAALDSLDIDLRKIRDSVDYISDPSAMDRFGQWGSEMVHLGGILGEAGDPLEEAKERVDGLDKALASLAQRDPDSASAALEAIKDAIGEEEFARLLPLLDDYEVSLVALDTAGRTGAAGIEEVTNAAGVSEDALNDLADAVDGIFDSLYGVEAASDQFQQGLNDLDEVMKQAVEDGLNLKDVLGDQSDGALALRGHMRDLANDAAAVIQEWVTQGITGQQLTDRIDGISESLRDQAAAAGVPESAIDHYLELLLAIPAEVPTTVVAEISDAEFKLRTIKQLLGQIPAIAGIRVDASYSDNAKSRRLHAGGPVSHLAGGGFPGRPLGPDTVPIWGAPGEFMMRRAAVDAIGVPTLAAMNATRAVPAAAPSGAQTTYTTIENVTMLDNQVLARSTAKYVRINGGDVQRVLGG